MSTVRTLTTTPNDTTQRLSKPQQTGLAGPTDTRKLSSGALQAFQKYQHGDWDGKHWVSVEIVASSPAVFEQAVSDLSLERNLNKLSGNRYQNRVWVKALPYIANRPGVHQVRLQGEAPSQPSSGGSAQPQQAGLMQGLPEWTPYAVLGGGALVAGGIWLSRR